MSVSCTVTDMPMTSSNPFNFKLYATTIFGGYKHILAKFVIFRRAFKKICFIQLKQLQGY